VLFGGKDMNTSAPLSDTWEWDGANWTQPSTTLHPSERYGHALAYDDALGAAVLFGGTSSDTAPGLSDAWKFDGTSWAELVTASSPQGRVLPNLTYDAAAGLLVLFGGLPGIMQTAHPYNDVWTFDGTRWRNATPSPQQPSVVIGQAQVFDSTRGVTMMFGGVNSDNDATADTWLWNGAQWTRATPSPITSGNNPSAR
jgi:hypothetical protein